MKKSNWLKVLCLSAFSVVMGIMAGFVDVQAADNSVVSINATNFPDAIFRAYVAEAYDRNSDGYLSVDERNAVTYVNVWEDNVTTLQGIKFFPNVQTIICGDSLITNLDLGGLSKLNYLGCDNTPLTSLDLTGCVSLEYLYCYDTELTSLDVSDCTALIKINCRDTSIVSLDVSGLKKLTTIDGRCCNLQTVNASGCSSLEELELYEV